MSQIWQTSIGFTPRSSKSKVADVVFANAGVANPSRSDRSPKNTLTKHSTPMSGSTFTVQKALPLMPERALPSS